MSAHRHITTGRDNWRQRPPQSEALRQHIHGRLIPMAQPRVGFWQSIRSFFAASHNPQANTAVQNEALHGGKDQMS